MARTPSDRAPKTPAERDARPADEDAAFQNAMKDVRPLARDRHLPEPVYREPKAISEREREALHELDALIAGDTPAPLHDSDELIEGKVPGLDPRTLKRMRRGEFTVQADLDLHGVDAETARGLLEQFVQNAHARGLRVLRVVHGRGRNSPGGVPVLKRSLPRWLARGPARRLVLGYTSAAPHDGGPGASYLLLRRSGR